MSACEPPHSAILGFYRQLLGREDDRARMRRHVIDFIRARLADRLELNVPFSPAVVPDPSSTSGLLVTVEGVPVYESDILTRNTSRLIEARIDAVYGVSADDR